MFIIRTILEWFKPSTECIEACIFTSMWAEGYTDFEIEEYLKGVLNSDEN